jgi:hypothetical protein
VAAISNAAGTAGLATSVATGATTIVAIDPGTGIQGSTTLTVTPAVLVSIAVTPANLSMAPGAARQFAATGTYSDSSTQDLTTSVTWSSTAPAVAAISNAAGSAGRATGVASGATTIVATDPGTSIQGATPLVVTTTIVLRGAAAAGAGSGMPSLTVATPAGTVPGDVMIAVIAVRPSTAVITPPAGWTLVRRLDNAGGATNSLATWRRMAEVGEPSNHTWTFSASTGSAGGIASFQSVDAAAPIDAENGQSTVSSLTHTTPDVTTTVANTMLFTAHALSSAATWSPPAGMTEAFDVASQATGSTGISVCGSWALHVAAGPAGARTATASNDADTGNAQIVALRW